MVENKQVFCNTCSGHTDYDSKFKMYKINDHSTNACSKDCVNKYQFYQKVNIDLLGCWEWKGAQRGVGYGALKVNGKIQYAHRFAFQLTKGILVPGTVVRHACDNRLCVNPNHLIEGTAKENTQDSIVRGRHKSFKAKKSISAA